MSSDAWRALLSHRLLQLILMPTEQCNFRCVYCYEDFQEGQMPQPVVEAVKALIARRISQLDLLSLDWFGGEPLLAFPVIEEVQGFARELVRDHPEVRLRGSITTNGSLLTRRRFERLLELGVRSFQISFDGTRDMHDAMRRRLGGGGSFKAIWRNLLAVRRSMEPFDVKLRLQVTRDNLHAIEQLLPLLACELAGDRRFSIMFKAIRRFGGPNDEELQLLPAEQEREILDRLVVRTIELGLNEKQDIFNKPGMLPGCYAAALGSYVVRSNGELAKCTANLSHPNNRIGALLPDGTVSIDSAKMTGWLRGALNGDTSIMKCPKKGWADEVQPRKAASPPPPLVQIGRSSSAVSVGH